MYLTYPRQTSLINTLYAGLILLPTPSRITLWWNFGSLLGLCLVIQIITGVILVSHYTPHPEYAFISIIRIWDDTSRGWLCRSIHANGSRFFFVSVYLHIGRGLYFTSWRLSHVWGSGVLIILLLIITSFLGYVLPWGQISFWGATVITNLLSAVPYFGGGVVTWLWGGFAISGDTLTRFFMLHFISPFILLVIVMAHLFALHITGSSSPVGVISDFDKVPFHPYFSYKDIVGVLVLLTFLILLVLHHPWLLGDPENFLEANPLITPIHIMPEWYFLIAYAILRSIPNKLGGVIGLVLSVIILWVLLLTPPRVISFSNSPFLKGRFFVLVIVAVLLTWRGGNPVEYPFIEVSQALRLSYFSLFMIIILLCFYFSSPERYSEEIEVIVEKGVVKYNIKPAPWR